MELFDSSDYSRLVRVFGVGFVMIVVMLIITAINPTKSSLPFIARFAIIFAAIPVFVIMGAIGVI